MTIPPPPSNPYEFVQYPSGQPTPIPQQPVEIITIQPFIVQGPLPEIYLVYDPFRNLIPPVVGQYYPPPASYVYNAQGQQIYVAPVVHIKDEKEKSIVDHLEKAGKKADKALKPITKDLNKAADQLGKDVEKFFKKLW